MRKQQLNLFTKSKFPNLSGVELEFGGSLRKGRRKIARPVDPKRPLHVVLRSSRARGHLSLLAENNKACVNRVLRGALGRYRVKILEKANVGNHIHLVIQPKTRKDFQGFMRMITGRIAALVTKAKKGRKVGRFWDGLAYTRIVRWGTDLLNVRHYITKNLFEGEGVELPTTSGFRTFRIRSGKLQS